jgi:hypothetical protein
VLDQGKGRNCLKEDPQRSFPESLSPLHPHPRSPAVQTVPQHLAFTSSATDVPLATQNSGRKRALYHISRRHGNATLGSPTAYRPALLSQSHDGVMTEERGCEGEGVRSGMNVSEPGLR